MPGVYFPIMFNWIIRKIIGTKNQRTVRVANELLADGEGLRQSVRRGLLGVADRDAILRSVAEQPLETRRVERRRDDQDVGDPRQHQRGQRVIDHRLVIDRDELLGHPGGDGV